MDRLNLVEKLRDKTNISYEEAKNALENNNWDILDALVYLEGLGKVKKPEVSEYYTNESKESYTNEGQLIKLESQQNNYENRSNFNGFFEAVCRVIDTGNNIFLEIKRHSTVILKIPVTVVILLLFLVFWIIIPLIVVALFFEVEFSIVTKILDINKINKINGVFKKVSQTAQDIKSKIKVHIEP